jgi:hypothetical protein
VAAGEVRLKPIRSSRVIIANTLFLIMDYSLVLGI